MDGNVIVFISYSLLNVRFANSNSKCVLKWYTWHTLPSMRFHETTQTAILHFWTQEQYSICQIVTSHLLKLPNLFKHWRIKFEVIYTWSPWSMIWESSYHRKYSNSANFRKFFKSIIFPVMLENNLTFETSENRKFFLLYISWHKKWSFPFKISSVSVTKSAENCGFGHIYWKNFNGKPHFFAQ